MEFIKKNVTLTVVLFFTGLISMVLIYMDYESHHKVTGTAAEIENLDESLKKIYRQTPRPVQKNYEMLKKDTADLRERTVELQRIFGKPYRNSLKEFAAILNLSESAIIERFKTAYDSVKKTDDLDQDRVAIFETFQNTFEDKQLFSDALQKFRNSVQQTTLEGISEEVGRDILMHALGLPRTMGRAFRCKTFVDSMQEGFEREKIIPGLPAVNSLDTIRKYTYDSKGGVPPTDLIVTIMRRFQIYEDLFRRLRASNVYALQTMEQTNQLVYGETVAGDYLKFSFKIRVAGEMSSIRNFINLLQKAYNENRVYLITSMDFSRVANDEVKFAMDKVISDMNVKENPSAPFSDFSAPANTSGGHSPEDVVQKPLDPSEKPGYGMTLIGKSRDVIVNIEFDYIIYVGDEIKQKR